MGVQKIKDINMRNRARKPEAYVEEKESFCEVCGEKTMHMDGIYQIYRDCACLRKERMNLRLAKYRKMSIIDRQAGKNIFSEAEYDDQKEEKLYASCKTYCQSYKERIRNNDGLLFFGDPGNGKTFLANCICNELEERGFTVLSFSLASYLGSLRDDLKSEAALLQAVKEVDMLFIDDLGSEQAGTPWAKEKIYSLLDARYRVAKPILITTNLGPVELEKFLIMTKTNKIFDRLKEMVEFVPFSWKSKRSRKRKRVLELL